MFQDCDAIDKMRDNTWWKPRCTEIPGGFNRKRCWEATARIGL